MKLYSHLYTVNEKGRHISMLQIVRNYEAAIRKVEEKILGGGERLVATEIRKGGALRGVHGGAFNGRSYYDLTIVKLQPKEQKVVAGAKVVRNNLTDADRKLVYDI